MKRILLATLLFVLSGHSLAGMAAAPEIRDGAHGKALPGPLEQSRLEERMRLKALASVGAVGRFVCRRLKVGISEHDWIRGYVVKATNRKITVRIVDPGQFPHQFDGINVAPGTELLDDDINWVPCIPGDRAP